MMVSLPQVEQDLRAFFEAMGSRSGELASSAELFHEQFFSLDPNSATLTSREQLRSSLPLRAKLFSTIGAVGTRLRRLEPVVLDQTHVLARTTWDVLFADETAQPLALESSYLLRRMDGRWQVLVYLNHHDVVDVISKRTHPRPTEDGGP